MSPVGRFNILKEALKRTEEELELSKGVEAQCSDLQAQLVELRGQLNGCHLEIDTLRGEIAKK